MGWGASFTSGLNRLCLSYLAGKFHNIGDQSGFGEDHCQFVDSFLDGRTGRQLRADQQPSRLGKHFVSCAPGRCLKMFSQLRLFWKRRQERPDMQRLGDGFSNKWMSHSWLDAAHVLTFVFVRFIGHQTCFLV